MKNKTIFKMLITVMLLSYEVFASKQRADKHQNVEDSLSSYQIQTFNKTDQSRLEEMEESLKNAQDLSVYETPDAKPTSIQEAKELLKNHFTSMITFHEEMCKIYQKYINSSLKELRSFLENQLGYILNKKRELKELAEISKKYHNGMAIFWKGKSRLYTDLSQETDISASWLFNKENQQLELFFLPDLEKNSGKTLDDCHRSQQQVFLYDLNNLGNTLKSYLSQAKNPIYTNSIINNQEIQFMFVNLWALRHAYELLKIEPWGEVNTENTDIKAHNVNAKADSDDKQKRDRNKKSHKRRTKRRREEKEKKEKENKNQQEKESHSLVNTNIIQSPLLPSLSQSQPLNASLRSLPILPLEETHPQSLSLDGPLPASPSSVNCQNNMSGVPIEIFDYSEYVKEQQRLSQHPKQKPSVVEETPADESQRCFYLPKTHFDTLTGLFQGKLPKFADFEKAFQNGLGGKVYNSRGGSATKFMFGKFSFLLHRPHGGSQGAPTFYHELRNMAISRLDDIGVTKDTIRCK